MRIGTIIELWRYPVKSLGGERLDQAAIGLTGLAGDRHWAVLDGKNGEIRSAKRWPELLSYNARFSGPGAPGCEDYENQVQAVEITTPDGQSLHSDEMDRDQRFSAWIGRPARLSRRHPSDDIDHYRLASVVLHSVWNLSGCWRE